MLLKDRLYHMVRLQPQLLLSLSSAAAAAAAAVLTVLLTAVG
jgi:hypothetical protein